MENYLRLRKLGSGNFAKVYLAEHIPTRKQVALKLINKKEISISNAQMFQRVHREINNMKKLGDHPSIVSIHETFETNKYYVIAMEYLPDGELFEYVLDKEGLKENQARNMFTQIVLAVQHCHENGVTHRDLKLENILLDKHHQPKLADFGLSKDTHTIPMLATYCGSPLYTSPEMLHGKPYMGPECDVWSLGVILYTMLTATMPFDDSNFLKFLDQVEKGEYPEPHGVSKSVKDLISKMLDPNAVTRYTVNDILAHPWMTVSTVTGRKRRYGVCYENNDDIRTNLLKLNLGVCTCYKSDKDRDSVISRHCTVCDEFMANDPEMLHLKQPPMSRNTSNCSSGYGSEYGSQHQLSAIPSHVPVFFNESAERRSSIPPKKMSEAVREHRSSVPILTQSNIITALEEDDDEDLVFV